MKKTKSQEWALIQAFAFVVIRPGLPFAGDEREIIEQIAASLLGMA